MPEMRPIPGRPCRLRQGAGKGDRPLGVVGRARRGGGGPGALGPGGGGLHPSDAAGRAAPELWRQLGHSQGERGQWKQAADALTKAVRFGAGEPAAWYDEALAQLSAGDVKGYRRTCERLVKKFGGRDEAAVRRIVADACILGPEAVANFKALVDRAEKAVLAAPADVEEQVRLAAVLLRAGRAGRAAELLEKQAGGEVVRSADRWLLVLAQEKAGRPEKAKLAMGNAMKQKQRRGSVLAEAASERLVAAGGGGGRQGGRQMRAQL